MLLPCRGAAGHILHCPALPVYALLPSPALYTYWLDRLPNLITALFFSLPSPAKFMLGPLRPHCAKFCLLPILACLTGLPFPSQMLICISYIAS